MLNSFSIFQPFLDGRLMLSYKIISLVIQQPFSFTTKCIHQTMDVRRSRYILFNVLSNQLTYFSDFCQKTREFFTWNSARFSITKTNMALVFYFDRNKFSITRSSFVCRMKSLGFVNINNNLY